MTIAVKRKQDNYKKFVKDRLDEVEEWASNAVSHSEMAKNLGVSYSAFRKYKDKHKALQEALDNGRVRAVAVVESALFKRAVGFEYSERTVEKKDVAGKRTEFIRETKKYQPGDTLAMMYFLNNRAPDKWKAKREDRADTEMNVTIAFNEEQEGE